MDAQECEELIKLGFVDEGKKNDLKKYFAARKDFLDLMAGGSSDTNPVAQAKGALRTGARAIHDLGDAFDSLVYRLKALEPFLDRHLTPEQREVAKSTTKRFTKAMDEFNHHRASVVTIIDFVDILEGTFGELLKLFRPIAQQLREQELEKR